MTIEIVLTDEQKAACGHPHARHARILAGPGTGKSLVLVSLLDRYAEFLGSSQVRLLTFTRAATAELLAKIVSASSNTQLPSTIHSFALSILMKNGGLGLVPEPLRLVNDWERRSVIEPSLRRRLGQPMTVFKKLMQELESGWEQMSPVIDSKTDSVKNRFLSVWREHRRIYGYALLSEIPYQLLQALRQHSDLEGVNFSVLIVDEYQDLNACDLAVIRKISSFGCAVICAGDDDQSIYSFRNAHPIGIRRFLKDYPGAKNYTLTIAQRCADSIIQWANHVIQGDPDRPEKKLLRSRLNADQGEVRLLGFTNESAEAFGVCGLVKGLLCRDRLNPEDILIMSRSDFHARFSSPVRDALERAGIPTVDQSRIDVIRKENAYVLAQYRLLANPQDSIAWATILQCTPGVGDTVRSYLYDQAKAEGGTFGQALIRLVRTNRSGAPRSAGAAVSTAVMLLDRLDREDVRKEKRTDWGQWLVELSGTWYQRPTEDLCWLLGEVDKTMETEQDLSAFLGRVEAMGRDLCATNPSGVRIMTMSGAKGLTVHAAILIGLEGEIIPRPNAPIAEERRILYVGMTRAKSHLYCTWAQRRTGPTARTGQQRVGRPRQYTEFLRDGPVESEDGADYLRARFGLNEAQ